MRQPTGHVAKGQVLDQRERFAQASREQARHRERDAGPLGDESQQLAAAQQIQRAVLDGLRAGRVGALVEDGDLVEHVARAQQAQHLLAAARRGLVQLQPAGLDDVQHRRCRALEQHDLTSRIAALNHGPCQRAQILGGQRAKEIRAERQELPRGHRGRSWPPPARERGASR